jgi:hypothetical protein
MPTFCITALSYLHDVKNDGVWESLESCGFSKECVAILYLLSFYVWWEDLLRIGTYCFGIFLCHSEYQV